MKFDVVSVFGGECLQEEAAEFGAGGAGQSGALPDFADRVASLIAAADYGGHFLLQGFVGAYLLFEFCHPSGGQHFVEPGSDFAIGPGHSGPLVQGRRGRGGHGIVAAFSVWNCARGEPEKRVCGGVRVAIFTGRSGPFASLGSTWGRKIRFLYNRSRSSRFPVRSADSGCPSSAAVLPVSAHLPSSSWLCCSRKSACALPSLP